MYRYDVVPGMEMMLRTGTLFKYILGLILATTVVYSQDDTFVKRISALEGRHFIIGFMQNEITEVNNNHVVQIFVVSRDTTEVTIEDQYYGKVTITALPDQVYMFRRDTRLVVTESEAFLYNVVDLTSEQPVSVFAFCSRTQSSDSYNAVPVSRWGKDYVVMSFPNDQYASGTSENLDSTQRKIPRCSEFMLLAAYDSTIITFTPKVNTYRGRIAGKSQNIRLAKGQCYLVKSDKYAMGEGDLSGTIITGSKPFGVLSGHVRTAIPHGMKSPYDSKNHLIEMLMPVPYWGQRFATAPYGMTKSGTDCFKITAYYDNTVVKYASGNGSATLERLNAGECAVVSDIYTPAYWESTKPVQLGQMIMHQQTNDVTNYDPALAIIPPIEQFIQKVTISTQGNDTINADQFDTNYVYIVCDKDAVDNIAFDKLRIDGFTDLENQLVPGTDIHYARFVIQSGSHTIETTKGSFGGVLFGRGDADAYAMILGIGLIDVNQPDDLPPVVVASDTCGNISGVITDRVGNYSSGLDYVRVRSDESYNYSVTLGHVSDTSTIVPFAGSVVDKYKDALLAIEIKDKDGNFRWYRHHFSGVNLKLNKDKIDFSDVDYVGNITELLNIQNTGKDTFVVYGISLRNNDSKLKLTIMDSFPYTLQKDGVLKYGLTFTPNGDLSDIHNTIVIDAGCGRYIEIPVSGTVLKHTVVVQGRDFGSVTVGKTETGSIAITNTGNAPITLTGLGMIIYSGAFTFDTTGLFPAVLPSGETFRVNVMFTPVAGIAYEDSGSYENNYFLPNTFIVKGNGISPNIRSVSVDWGKRRCGTSNDTTVVLKNEGNDSGRLTYSGLTSNDTEFDVSRLKSVDNELKIGDSLLLHVGFNPVNSVNHREVGRFTVDWPLHDTVGLELLGTGTLPSMQAYDIDCDTVEVNSSNTVFSLLFETGGNEGLTIDSVKIAGEKDPSFKFGPALSELLANTSSHFYLPGSKMQEDIIFTPDKPGLHEMTLEITHDGAPAYKRLKSRIRLTGYGEYSSADSYLIVPDSIVACKTFEAGVVIRNTGMVDFLIQELELKHDNSNVELDWKEDYTQLLPITLRVDSSCTFMMKGFAKRDEEDEATVTVTINDTIQKHLSYTIAPVPSVYKIGDIDDFTATVGDTVAMSFSGSFLHGTELPVVFNMVLDNFLQKLYYCISPVVVLKVSDGSGNETSYDLTVVQEAKRIVLSCSEPVSVPDKGCTWSFNLVFKVLLGNELGSRVTAYSDYSECYRNDSIDFYAGIDQVCMYKYSGITLIEPPVTVKALTNPATGSIELSVGLLQDDVLDIALFDNAGREISLGKGIVLKKGSNGLAFPASSLPAGAYMLSVTSAKAAVSVKLIIEK